MEKKFLCSLTLDTNKLARLSAAKLFLRHFIPLRHVQVFTRLPRIFLTVRVLYRKRIIVLVLVNNFSYGIPLPVLIITKFKKFCGQPLISTREEQLTGDPTLRVGSCLLAATLSIMTLSIKGLLATLSVYDNHNNLLIC